MKPKSGLPKRKALRNMPQFEFGFKDNPSNANRLHPSIAKNTRFNGGVTAVSLFAGCGGLDLGLMGGFSSHNRYYEPLPFDLIAAYDNDQDAVETYRMNLTDHAECVDLADVDLAALPEADLLLGGFPCQDFSSCGHKRGFEGSRGRLYEVMVEYMRIHQPMVVIGENVPLLAGMKNGDLLKKIIADLEGEGYKVKTWFLNCPDYGLPASRRRIFIVCVRNDLPGFPRQPMPTHVMRHLSIDEAIDDLIGINDETVTNQSQYFVATKATAGAGQGDQVSQRGQLGYAVRANPKGRVHFHYELDRRLTVRETARLQSFPDEFVFPYSTGANMKLIGNAVPPIVGHHVGRSIADYFADLAISAEKRKATA
ncbi:DNA cytosine methyltransferase [Rhizobium leguminosarum]|uniref:DNA cytosine methyltransferase n=1 Tax=Rhizobium leguminosarum TaxID=384 RepID=UPI003F998085